MRSKSGLAAAVHHKLRQGWAEAFAASLPADEGMFLEPLAPHVFDAKNGNGTSTRRNRKVKTEN